MRILIFAAVLVMSIATVTASDVIGIYAIVDKVVLQPDEDAPDRIQIWGSFLVADGQIEGFLPAVENGYMYFALPDMPAEQARAKAEWNDFKKIAGTGKAVGFGGRIPTTRIGRIVRKPSDRPERQKRDLYPLNIGVVPVTRTDIIERLHGARSGL